MRFKISSKSGAIVLASLAISLSACEDTGEHYSVERATVDGLPTVTATASAKATAIVDAVDYGNRSIALTGPNGKTEIFTVSSSVRNFNQIKKGDTVNVEYFTKMFASVRQVNEMPTTQTTQVVKLAELGEKPGIVCSRHSIIEANVVSIDYGTRVVKLKTTTGDIMTITADPKLKKRLKKVHNNGDQVVFDLHRSGRHHGQ